MPTIHMSESNWLLLLQWVLVALAFVMLARSWLASRRMRETDRQMRLMAEQMLATLNRLHEREQEKDERDRN